MHCRLHLTACAWSWPGLLLCVHEGTWKPAPACWRMHMSPMPCLFRVERRGSWPFMMKCTGVPFSFYPLGFYQRQAWGGQSHCIWPGQCALRLQLPPHQELPRLQGCCRSSRKVSFKFSSEVSESTHTPTISTFPAWMQRLTAVSPGWFVVSSSPLFKRHAALARLHTLYFHRSWVTLYRKKTKSEMFCSFQCSYILQEQWCLFQQHHSSLSP